MKQRKLFYAWAAIALLPFISLAQQTPVWQTTWGIASRMGDNGHDMVVLSSGNVIAVGEIDGTVAPDYASDVQMVKYDRDGHYMRSYARDFYNQDLPDKAQRILLREPYIYVVGTLLYRAGSGYIDKDILLMKMDTSLNLVWTHYWNGYNLNGHYPNDAAADAGLDAAGNLYITGTTERAGSGTDILLVKYNDAGAMQYASYVTSPDSADDAPCQMVVLPSGSVCLAGTVSSLSDGTRMTAMRFNAAGVKNWQRYHDVKANAAYADHASAITVDPVSHVVYITGKGELTPGNFKCGVAAFDGQTGQKLWSRRFTGASGYPLAEGTEISYVGPSALYVAGNQHGTTASHQGMNFFLRKLNPATGSAQWTRSYDSPGHGDDYCTSMLTVPSGHIYLCGYTDIKAATYKRAAAWAGYSATGALLYADTIHLNLSATCIDQQTTGIALRANPSGNDLYFLGAASACVPVQNTWLLSKYHLVPLRIADPASTQQDATIQVYPNPVQGQLTVLSDAVISEVRMVDLQGREVWHITGDQSTYQFDLSSFDAGLYLVQLHTESGWSVKRVVKE